MKRTGLIGAALAALFVSTVWAKPMATDPMAEKVLAQMSSAFKNRAWSGMMMYTRGEQSVSLQFHQDVVGGKTIERIERLSGDPIQVMRRGNWLLGLYPGAESLRQGHNLPTGSMPSLNERIQHIKTHYTLELGAVTRVAGRAATPILLRANDEYRYSRRYWCDNETGLMLRSQTLSHSGAVLEQFEFVSVELGAPIDDDTLVVDAQGMQVFRHALVENSLTDTGPIRSLPKGFMPLGQGAPDQEIITHLFSDGVSLVSVFYEKVAGPAPSVGAQQGPTRALSKVLAHNQDYYKVTVVGEVPRVLLEALVKQVDTLKLAGMING